MADVAWTMADKCTRVFLLRMMMEKATSRRKRMQTVLHYIVTRRRRLINVCLITLLLLLSRDNAITPAYSCSWSRLLRKNLGWFNFVAIIFQSTKLWTAIKENDLIPYIGNDVSGVLVPPLVLGDSACPLQTWLMKPYGNAVLTPKQRYFNYRLSRARMVTQCCYG